MILINLLPHREVARKRQKDQFYTQLGLSALLGGIIGGAVFTWYQGQISAQQERNQFLQTEIAKLDAEIKDIASLQQQIASLRARQTAAKYLDQLAETGFVEKHSSGRNNYYVNTALVRLFLDVSGER